MLKKSAGIIGTGRLGGALAKGLFNAGYEVRFLASQNRTQAEKIAKVVGASIIEPPYRELNQIDLVFLTIPDNEIAAVVNELAAIKIDWKGKLVFHCSGAAPSDILKPLKDKGAVAASLHPLQTFPPDAGPERFKDVYFAVEGNGYTPGASIAKDLGGIPIRLDSVNKTLYHAAACTVSNFLTGLTAAAREMLFTAGNTRDIC